ncbi:MAG: hypothetical protein M3Y24_03080 [Acidobacteriota bacterium]|nr:hypothetical protein [Acidobacteriota bacterium]
MAISNLLFELGIPVLRPIEGKNGRQRAHVGKFSLLVFPFVQACHIDSKTLADGSWRLFGSILSSIHNAPVPKPLLAFLDRESFSPYGQQEIDRFDVRQ